MHSDDNSDTGANTGQEETVMQDQQIVRAAKQKRSTAKRLFTMSIGSMTSAISRRESIQEVQTLFTTVNQRWQALQEKYADYLSCLLSDEEEPPQDETQWIKECNQAFMND